MSILLLTKLSPNDEKHWYALGYRIAKCVLDLTQTNNLESGLEVIKFEYSLKPKIKRNQPNIALYFESENEL